MKYPFRYDVEVGIDVWVTTCDEKGNWEVRKDRIVEKVDYGDLIVYFVEKYNPGHGLKFGQGLYLTKDEAESEIC